MRRTLTDGAPGTEFWQAFLEFKHSAWRWEHQPAYYIGYEHQQFDDFLAGRPEPPTDYQRWMQWMDRWNREAGEAIQYLPRTTARQAGLPVDSPVDWWLFDDERLLLMHHDPDGRRIKVEMLIDEPDVAQARTWRKLAIEIAQQSNDGPER